jgi:ABC-type branched-subunit amino acid transport system substrate-binding protein
LLAHAAPAHAADPMKVGLSLSLTGGVASNGKQILMALELWRDDVNAKGGFSVGRSSSSTTMIRAARVTCRRFIRS